jgi:hypothetical protein
MGIGPSYNPVCVYCKRIDIHTDHKVTYVARLKGFLPTIAAWQTLISGDIVVYWACNGCYNDIPDDCKSVFIHDDNYIVVGFT